MYGGGIGRGGGAIAQGATWDAASGSYVKTISGLVSGGRGGRATTCASWPTMGLEGPMVAGWRGVRGLDRALWASWGQLLCF